MVVFQFQVTNVKPGDVIGIKDSKSLKEINYKNLESPALSNVPQNLDFDKKNLTAKVLGIIDREWIALKLMNFLLLSYSRKI